MPKSLEEFVRSDRLPSLPQVVVRVIELARDPDPDFGEVVATLRTDAALTGRIMRTTNSALFGLSRTVKSLEQAVPVLGLTMLRTIVLGFTLADHESPSRDARDASQALWRSSLTQAVFAEALAQETTGADPATWFLAGLLQDIGILAALHTDTDNYLTHVWDNCEFPNVRDRELGYYGFTHTDIARELTAAWGLPKDVRTAMTIHHSHMQTGSGSATAPLATALQAAALCAQYVINHRDGGRPLEHLHRFLSDHYNWSSERIEESLEETTLRVSEAAALFNFDVGKSFSPQRVLGDALVLLQEIAITSQIQHRISGGSPQPQPHRPEPAVTDDEAMRDPMTGVYNRRYMDRVLNSNLAKHIRKQQPIGLLFLDVDRFKSINDEHGHRSGDRALCYVADTLRQSIRESDSIIRYGGDEFLVCLPNASADTVSSIAERIRAGISDEPIEGVQLRMTTSVGAVHYCPGENDPLDANWLIDRVDNAMYEAKRNGGDQVHLLHVPGALEATAVGPAL